MKVLEFLTKTIEILGVSFYIPKNTINNTIRVNWEKHLLTKKYDFLDMKIVQGCLHCRGACMPSEFSIKYEYKVIYSPDKHPSVYCLNPQIKYHEEIHMYPYDNRLCLYYPKDFSWTSASHLFDTIIPWTHEWFLFYELYLIGGTWLHPSVPHKRVKKL